MQQSSQPVNDQGKRSQAVPIEQAYGLGCATDENSELRPSGQYKHHIDKHMYILEI